MKSYYGELTYFLIEKQNKARHDELETEFARELEHFLHFWENTFKELEIVSKEEVNNIILSNKELSKEAYEILETVVGFRPPPDKMFNDLMAIRSIAVKLKNDDTLKLINFDYLKKRNEHINEKWIKDRKQYIIRRMNTFEELLSLQVDVLKYKLNQELWRLQRKRTSQYDKLTVKYMKCKNIVDSVNAGEMQSLKKLKTHFMTKNGVPKVNLPEEPETDNILADLEPNSPPMNLLERFKAMGLKDGNAMNKSVETIDMSVQMQMSKHAIVKTEKGTPMGNKNNGKQGASPLKNGKQVATPPKNGKQVVSPQKNGKPNANGGKNLDKSMESQRTVTKKSVVNVQNKVKTK